MGEKKTSFVYGLVDPRDNFIHYIGKASDRTRPYAHRRDAKSSRITAKCKWLVDLFDAGLDYSIVVLEAVDQPLLKSNCHWWLNNRNMTLLSETECWWIAYGRALGWPLKNQTDGGDGALFGANNPSKRPEIREKRRLQWAVNHPSKRPQNRKKISERNKARWTQSLFRDSMTGEHNPAKRPEVRAKMSLAWDDERRANVTSGELRHTSKLRQRDVDLIRSKYETEGYTQKELGKMFGVSGSTIGEIVRYEIWKAPLR